MENPPSVELGPYQEETKRTFLSLPSAAPASPTSSSSLETLSWDVSFSVTARHAGKLRDKGAKHQQRSILSNIVGEAVARNLVAVMGASGCGKTTFLSCLALRNQSFEGNVYLNRKPVDATYLPLIGFVDQHDMFIPTLTVWEHLSFHVMVRLGAAISRDDKLARAESMLREFNLLDVADSYIGGGGSLIRGISHGEQKRLSFATELLPDPYIIIADEPTTGLDALLAANVCQTLRNMADSGRIVVSTIHQPSSKAFSYFSHVLLLALGRTVYYGPTDTLISYFNSLELACPESHNPADFVVQRIAVPPDDQEEGTQAVQSLIDQYEESALGVANRAWLAKLPEQVSRDQIFSRRCSASFFTQLGYDLVRHSRANFRDTRTTMAKMGVGIIMGLLFGLAYREAPGPMTPARVTDRLGLHFIACCFITTTAILLVARSLPKNLHLFLRERMAGVTRVSTHYIATVLSTLPSDLLWMLLFTVPLFLLAVHDITLLRFCIFTGIMTLLYVSSTSIGYFLSALTMNEAVALALMPPVAMPMILFAGLLVNVPDVPWPLRWIEHFSLVKYAYHALVIKEFEGFVMRQPCHQAALRDCPVVTGRDIMERVNVNESELVRDLCILGAFTVGFHVLGYLCLVWRAKRASK